MVEALLARYPVEGKGTRTRNSVLMELIGDLAHKFGREAAERIVEEHYWRNQQNIRSSLDEHLREFGTAWDGMRKKLVDSLSAAERQKFDALGSQHQREGFLIVRAFAGAAAHNSDKDFPIARASLADRLSITPPGRYGCYSEVVRVESHRPDSALYETQSTRSILLVAFAADRG